jgi:hypothetical protein
MSLNENNGAAKTSKSTLEHDSMKTQTLETITNYVGDVSAGKKEGFGTERNTKSIILLYKCIYKYLGKKTF